MYENAEDPLEVLDKKIPIDFNYYLERRLKKPLTRIFKLIMQNPESLFMGKHTKNRFQAKITKNSALGRFFKAKLTCLGCRAPIKKGAVCKKCDENVSIF